MATYLLNYATARFYDAQERLNQSALRFGIESILSYRFEDLRKTDFYQEHRKILDRPRGAGFYLWKPYFISEALASLHDGDVLVYSDCGAEISGDLSPLFDLSHENGGILLFACHGHRNSTWTKRDCFIRMDCDQSRFHQAEQAVGGYQVFVKNRLSTEFVKEWLRYCCEPEIVTDDVNVCGLPNLVDYLEHRHDQSVLSLLAERYGIRRYRDPSQWGNHLKRQEFRRAGEFLPRPYDEAPDKRSPYGTLIDLHRLGPRQEVPQMQQEKLTVIIVHRDGSQQLLDSLTSLQDQLNPSWQCLILDIGGAVSLREMLNQHQRLAGDSRIHVIVRPDVTGMAKAIHTLVEAAQTSFIGVLNSGDALLPECIDEVLRVYRDTDRSFVYTNFVWCDSRLAPQQLGFCRAIPAGKNNLETGCISHFKTFRKSAFELIAGLCPDLELAVDADLIYQLEEVTAPFFLDKPLYLHRAPNVTPTQRSEIARQASTEDERAKDSARSRRKLETADTAPPCGTKSAPETTRTPWSQEGVLPEYLGKLIPVAATRVLVVRCSESNGNNPEPYRFRMDGRDFTVVHDGAFAPVSQKAATEEAPVDSLWNADGSPRLTDFDCVVYDRLDCVRDMIVVLAKLHEVLKGEGSLLASFGNVQHHRVLSGLIEGRWCGTDEDPDRLRFLTRREVEKLLFRTGFEIVSLQPVTNHLISKRQKSSDSEFGKFLLNSADLKVKEQFQAERFVVCAQRTPQPDYEMTSIIILTHNELPYTRECLESIWSRTDEPYELILVDNGSTDGTVEYLQSLDGIKLIQNSTNRGFPAAVNQGIEIATGRYILLLNNDCLVTTGWLRRLLATMCADSEVGLVGPVSNCTSGYQQVPVNYSNLAQMDSFAWDWAQEHSGYSHEVDRLIGFCLLIRRDLIHRIGVLDERFGVGCYEDDDYCRRARNAGFKAMIAGDAFVHHYGSRTFVGSGADFAAILRENERKYLDKWLGHPSATTQPFGSRPVHPKFPGLSVEIAPTGGLRLFRSHVRLSLCMIVRNNETTIRPCLESIRRYVDEMIVVDTGSTDNTPDICRELGARVYFFEWCDDFSAARNESLRHACGDWLFWMDSDDTIPADCGRQLRQLADGPHQDHILGYVMQVHCPGADRHDITVVDHIKLFRNRQDLRFEFRLHEQILPAIRRAGGDVEFTDIHVVHSGADCSPRTREKKLLRDLRILGGELSRYPNHPFVLFNLGMTYSDVEQHAEAVTYLKKCISVSIPEESHLRKAYAMHVHSLTCLKRRSEAWESCLEGLQLYPQDKELLFRKAMLLHDFGRMVEAIETYQQILTEPQETHFASRDIGTHSYKAQHNLALIYEDMGEYFHAENEWKAILRDVPDYQPAQVALAKIEAARKPHRIASGQRSLPV